MTDEKKVNEAGEAAEAVSTIDSKAQKNLAAEAEAAETARQKLDVAREKLAQGLSGVEKTLDQAREGAGRTSKQVKEKAQQASVAAREKAERASAAAKERYDHTVEHLRVGYDKVQKDMNQLGHDVNDYVQANPGKSVLMAAGVGFLLGMLLRGGRSRD